MSTCPACQAEFDSETDDHVEDALRELVELKRMKDASGPTDEYKRRRLIAWRNAFRALDIIGDPRP